MGRSFSFDLPNVADFAIMRNLKVLIASKPVYTAIMKTISQEFSETSADLQKDLFGGGGGT